MAQLFLMITKMIPPPSVHDVSLDPVDEYDYYGADFRGSQRVYKLFFMGSSDRNLGRRRHGRGVN